MSGREQSANKQVAVIAIVVVVIVCLSSESIWQTQKESTASVQNATSPIIPIVAIPKQRPPEWTTVAVASTSPHSLPAPTLAVHPTKPATGNPRECMVNAGRPCTPTEHRIAGISCAAGSDFQQLVLADVSHRFSVSYVGKSQIYNPGLIVRDGRLWMIVRHEGRNATGRWTTCPESSLHGPTLPCPVQTLRMVSFVAIIPLGPDLKPNGVLQCVPYDFQWESVAQKRHERQLGPEDPRPFEWGSEWYVVTNGPPIQPSSNPHCVRNMKLQRIFPTSNSAIDMEVIGDTDRIEKNWAPLEPSPTSDAFYFARKVEPFEVLSCGKNGSCFVVSSTSQKSSFDALTKTWRLKALHLGTNAVKLRNGLSVAILHGVSAVSARTYLNFVYVFKPGPTWMIVGVGARPLEPPMGTIVGGFVWTANLAWLGDQLVVGYTVKDRSANLWRVNTSTLLSNINAL